MVRVKAPPRLLPPVVRFSPIGGWPAGAVQGEGVVVCLDFEVVFVDAGQLSYNRDTILAAINVDSREKTRSRQLARRRKGTQDAIHFVLQSAQLAKRIGGSKKAEGKQSGHRSFLPQGPMAVPFSACTGSYRHHRQAHPASRTARLQGGREGLCGGGRPSDRDLPKTRGF
jgi:hypothetical protein